MKRKLKWPLLLILPIALIPAAWMLTMANTALYITDVFAPEPRAEKLALAFLSEHLETERADVVAVEYGSPKDQKPLNQKPSKLPSSFTEGGKHDWRYQISYNRREKTLTKSLFTTLPVDESKPTRTWRWKNVEENAIHQVAAPMREWFNSGDEKSLDSYQNSNLSELDKYGATLAP